MKRLIAFVLFLPFLLLIASCSDKSEDPNNNLNPPVEQTIGPEGGVIQIGGQIQLVVIPGALSNTVEFSLIENESPAAPPAGKSIVSSCFTIEPSGTTFAEECGLTIFYDPIGLGAREASAAVYMHEGDGWQSLTSGADTVDNMVVAVVNGLCDFAVMVDEATGGEGAYAQLGITRMVVNYGDHFVRTDLAHARFDSIFAPCGPVYPREPDSVRLNDYGLTWDEHDNQYRYYLGSNTPFIQLGTTYTFHVFGNSTIPSLTASIEFPAEETYITSPAMGDTLSLSGFTVNWAGSGAGIVEFVMVVDSDSSFTMETPNDGSYSFTQSQLSGIQEGEHGLVMYHHNMANITATGYDPRSVIWGRVVCSASFYLR